MEFFHIICVKNTCNHSIFECAADYFSIGVTICCHTGWFQFIGGQRRLSLTPFIYGQDEQGRWASKTSCISSKKHTCNFNIRNSRYYTLFKSFSNTLVLLLITALVKMWNYIEFLPEFWEFLSVTWTKRRLFLQSRCGVGFQQQHWTWRRWAWSTRFPLGVPERLSVSPGYLTFYPGQRQVVAQAQPIQSAWMQSEERTGALGVLGGSQWTGRTGPGRRTWMDKTAPDRTARRRRKSPTEWLWRRRSGCWAPAPSS